jgi:hypothetical protein
MDNYRIQAVIALASNSGLSLPIYEVMAKLGLNNSSLMKVNSTTEEQLHRAANAIARRHQPLRLVWNADNGERHE